MWGKYLFFTQRELVSGKPAKGDDGSRYDSDISEDFR